MALTTHVWTVYGWDVLEWEVSGYNNPVHMALKA